MAALWLTLIAVIVATYSLVPRLLLLLGAALGKRLQQQTRCTRELFHERANSDKDSSSDEWEEIKRSQSRSDSDVHVTDLPWQGIVGFFHPFCNAGGGGERVLWAAIKATQRKWPKALCVVYTGDHDAKEHMLERVLERFNIRLDASHVEFIYMTSRHYVLSSTWPRFTLLGQSLGSLILGYDAFGLLVPDIFIDTMGYAFVIAFCKILFPHLPTGAYVHYPTISTDMIESLNSGKVNASAGRGLQGKVKQWYWLLFAKLYGWVGGCADVVMTNSSWTQAHIKTLWGHDPKVVFPPVAVEELEHIEINGEREPTLLYIAQFRPEKNHTLVLKAFAQFLAKCPSLAPSLVLIGSVRDAGDEKHIYNLRLLVHELRISDHVTFLLNAPWDAVLEQLRTASIGVNCMWNEHFGIGVVEYQAAGLIGVVHDSGGPKMDIVVDMPADAVAAGPTGLHAVDADTFAAAFERVLVSMTPKERHDTRMRARKSSTRFSASEFEKQWLIQMDRLVELTHGH